MTKRTKDIVGKQGGLYEKKESFRSLAEAGKRKLRKCGGHEEGGEEPANYHGHYREKEVPAGSVRQEKAVKRKLPGWLVHAHRIQRDNTAWSIMGDERKGIKVLEQS